MTDNGRRDLEEEAIALVLRRRPRDVRIRPFAAVEARLQRRAPLAFMLASALAVVVVGLAIGDALAERRALTPAAPPSPSPAGVREAAATMPAASPSPSPTASAGTSIASDRFGFVWIDGRIDEPRRPQVRPEAGGGVVLTVPALPYSLDRCGCQVSPDGTRIVYWTTRTAPDDIELRVVELGRPSQATTIYKAAPNTLISSAAWSSDGTGILISISGLNPPGSYGSSHQKLLAVEASGGPVRVLDSGAGEYVPLGWDRTAEVAAAAISGGGGYMSGYLTVHTGADPSVRHLPVDESVLVFSIDISSDQRYASAVFFQRDMTGSTLRWWKLADFDAMSSGPAMELPTWPDKWGPAWPKWRPGTSEIGWISRGTLQLHDVERGTTRAAGRFPTAEFGLAAFRHDGSAVAGKTGSTTILMELASGHTETITGSGYIAGAVRLP